MSAKMRSTGRFSTAQDERLIEMVTNYPIIWNMEHPEFKNTSKKDSIWVDIGKAVNRTDVQCKVRWKSIRDHYKRQRKPTEGTKKRASYWDKLTFLDGAEDEERRGEAVLGVRCRYDSDLVKDLADICAADPLDLLRPGRENVIVSLAASTSAETKTKTTTTTKCEKDQQQHDMVEHGRTDRKEERLKYRRMLEQMIESDEENEIDLFFKTMAATVKKFDSQTRAEAKMKIFNVVTELEMTSIKAKKMSDQNHARC